MRMFQNDIMVYTCNIIDDEDLNIDTMSKYIAKTEGLELIGTATDPLIALQLFEEEKIRPDITFLDVDMPKMTGIQVFERIRHCTEVVFYTAFFDVSVLKKLNALYVLKPVTYGKFLSIVEQAKERIADKRQ